MMLWNMKEGYDYLMNKYCRYIGVLIGFFLLAGCTALQAEQSLFTEAEEQVIWHGERTGTFGNYDYTNLANEAEAQEILTEKFNLSLPKNYETLKIQLASTAYLSSEQLLGEACEVIVSDQQVNYHVQQQYGEESVEVVVEFSLTYTIEEESKRVILADQTLLLQDVSSSGTAGLYEAITELVPLIGKNLSFDSEDKVWETFMDKYQEVDDTLAQQTVVIQENVEEAKENKGLQKSIQVYYDATGQLREIYFNLTDLSEE